MKKILMYAGIAAILLLGAFYFLNGFEVDQPQSTAVLDYKNAEYTIESRRIKLENGFSEIEAAPGSASKIVTRYFGNEVWADLNGDDREDVVFLLTQEGGGIGSIFLRCCRALD